MAYTVDQAKTNLSKLIEEALRGKEVVIARGKKPVVKIVPILNPVQKRRKKRVPGEFAGKYSYTPDAFNPLTETSFGNSDSSIEWCKGVRSLT